MKRSTVVLCAVLLFSMSAFGVQYAQNLREEAAANEARMQQEAAVAAARAAAAAAQAAQAARIALLPPFEDRAMAHFVPRTYPRPVSEWQRNEKAFYEKTLLNGKFDVLVVPFQVWGWAVDRPTRSLMTAELAMGLAQSQKVKIPDPYLVAKALGEGQRQLKQEDVYKLADAMGVKRIIWGYAGHDRKGKMSVAVLTQDYTGVARDGARWPGPVATKKFEGISLDGDTPAVQAYESLLPEILKALGADAASPVFARTQNRLEMTALPQSPLGLAALTGNPAQDAYGFLLYSALTPANTEKAKEIFAEKALLALLSLSPASPEYRALRARAYMILGERMAAIKLLDTPQTDEEKGLLAALNGNLPEVRAMAAREKNPLKKLIQKLDENRIAAAYGVITAKKSVAEVAALKLPGEIWPYVVTRAFVDWDVWSQYDNASLKMLLDYELPVKGHSLEEMARGSSALGDPAKIQTVANLSVFNHGRQFIDANVARLCCEFVFDKPGPLDYLALLQETGNDNLMRYINFLSYVQGTPAKALSFANTIDASYKGYPYYAMERSRVEARLAVSGGGPEKAALDKAYRENAFNAYYWEQGQSLVADRAREQFGADGKPYYGHHDNLYYTDIPYRPYYWTWADGGAPDTNVNNDLAAFRSATTQIHTLAQLAYHYRMYPDKGQVSELMKSITGRFVGSPRRNEILLDEALERGDGALAQALLRENIRLSPAYWPSYEALGKLLIESGDVNAAAKVFHAYEGFKKGSEESRVGTANYAYEAGSYFYWTGHFDLAVPFYRIAVSQGTGAAGEMTADVRLKLLAGDLNGAMASTLKRAQRYNQSYAYRDYLGMLHASGHFKEAWDGFKVLVKETKEPHIWESALVGHHMAGLSEAEVVAWARQSEFKGAGEANNAAAIYLVRFATTDRTPSAGLSAVIDAMDQQWWKVPQLPAVIPGDSVILKNTPEKRRVKSVHAYFVEAYRAIKLKDFAAAKSIFDEAAASYDFSGQTGYLPYSPCFPYLPYYAYAAAKVGDTSGVEKILGGLKKKDQRFDYYLAKAILAGASGKKEEALQSLRDAQYHRPHTEQRVLLTQYTFGEVAGLVADLTDSDKIREAALDWAKRSQKFEPWQSWPYALEARLTKNPAGRKRAVAMAFYLDPKSESLSAFKQAEIDAATKAFGQSNPFLDLTPKIVKKSAI
ncbi:tetratricopeptide repeat protein [Polaromonas sp. YR568]|uniref:tetratricopeptide repeat protein n=1 Tax=Polaromonas sp. YR568 TaxID=1855301 RepID=UPI00398BC6EC